MSISPVSQFYMETDDWSRRYETRDKINELVSALNEANEEIRFLRQQLDYLRAEHIRSH